MTSTLVIELAAKSAVVAGAALVLLAVLKTRSAAERSWVAHAALAVLLALPAATLLLPRWRLLSPVQSVAALSAPAAVATPDPTTWMQALYLGGAGLLLFATLVAMLRLVALRRDAAVLVDPDWLTALALARARMKVRSRAALLVSQTLTSPVSWGFIRPTIVVNAGLVASKADAEAVIAHELAHVVHLDWAKLIAARVITALFWFNPLVWLLASQCHQLREEAADDAVLGADVPSADYASLLVEAARREGRGGLIAAHGVAPGKGSLHRRVTRVLDVAARRTPTPAAWAFGVAVSAMLLAGPLAALTLERAEAAPADQVTPAATTVPAAEPAAPIVEPARMAEPATKARPAAVTLDAAPRAKAASTVTVATSGLTRATPAEAAAAAVTILPVRKGRLTATTSPAQPRTVTKARLTRTRVDPAAPRASKTAAAATVSIAARAPKVAVAAPGQTATITRKGETQASASASQTLTATGRTLRIEADADAAADRDDRRRDRDDQADDKRDAERDAARGPAQKVRAVNVVRRKADVAARVEARAAADVERRKTATTQSPP